MAEQIAGEVIHVVPPAELDDYELDSAVESLAKTRYLLVCRKGGVPSFIERVIAFLRRDPIEPVTLVADSGRDEGTELTAVVEQTSVEGVYEVLEFE
jgi:hypothetical protein